MVAEAQASGVGVIVYNLRESLGDYVTENGYMYKNDEEVIDIISNNFDYEKRMNAVVIARERYDIKEKIKNVENIWMKF
jgi:glycosyltransferase involved in cell wall biosynthesis